MISRLVLKTIAKKISRSAAEAIPNTKARDPLPLGAVGAAAGVSADAVAVSGVAVAGVSVAAGVAGAAASALEGSAI